MIRETFAAVFLHIAMFVLCAGNAIAQIIHDDIEFQTERRTFKHYSTASGLSANRVFDLEPDSKGGLWIATDFGMNRFDGRTFRSFSRDEYPEIKRRDIRTMLETKDGMLVGSANGLLLYYNEKEDTFSDAKPADYDDSYYKEVTGFFDFGNEIYASTIGGIYKWNSEEKKFASDFPAFVTMQNTYVRSMHRDRRGRYWLGSIETLEVFDRKGKCLKVFGMKENVKGMVYKMLNLGRDKVMVCTSGDKYLVFDTSKEELEPETEITVPFISTYDALVSRNGDIYIGTDGTGLWRMTLDKNWRPTFTHIIPFGDAYNDMKKVYTLCETDEGDLWIGTQRSGVFRMARKGIEDVSFSSEIGLEKTVCSDFIELDNGEIVATSDGDGILILSSDMEVIRRVKTPCDNMLSANLEKDGKVRVCTWGEGCVIYDPKTGKCEIEQFKGVNPRPKCVFTTMQTKGGDIYVCTGGSGLLRRKSGRDTWEKVPLEEEGYTDVDMWVFKAAETKDGAIWVITTNTVWKIKDGQMHHMIENIRSEKTTNPMWLTDIDCADNGDALISTNRGVMRVSDEKAEFLNYIPKLEYMSIEKMRDGRFCATAFGGTIIIDEKEKKYQDLPGNFKDMEKSQFYTFSLREMNNGTLLAGTYSGFYIFNPKVVSREEGVKNRPEVKKVFCGGKKLNLKERIIRNTAEIDEIQISSNEAKNIQIEIEQTDFRSQAAYHLYYRLKEEGDQWNTVDQEKNVLFTFLPQGTHTLQIAYSPSAEGILEANCTSVKLVVLPPWWRSGWFIAIYITAFLAILFLAYRIRIRRMKENEDFLRQKVAEQTSDLQKALADKEGLISVIAHDLKNPLFGIVGQLEESIRRNQNADERVKKAYQQAANLQRAMTDLVDWAKEKREKLVPIVVETELSAMAESAITLHNALIENKEITLTRKYDAVQLALTDERLTTTILRNLIGNSVKYTPRGGEICVETADIEGNVSIAVKDNGVGMTEDQVRKILEGKTEKGEGTEGTDGEKSTGLGMGIVRDCTEKLGAELKIESEKGKGTTVTVIFEASGNAQKERTEAEETEITSDADGELKGKRILVAEDDDLVRDYLVGALGGICKVFAARDGEEAMDILRKEDIDIILSDMQMPKKNGLQLCQDMNADNEMRHLPFIFMSATSGDGLKMQGLDAGAIDFINKPFDIRELKIKLGNVLRISRLAAKKQAETMLRGKPEEKEKADPFAKKFMETLETVYGNSEMSVGALSSMLNMSTATLGRKCLASLGKSPMQLLQDMRMAKAIEMLKNKETEETISEISYKVGFADPAYFSRKFKEHFGFNPSEVG